MFDIFFLKFDWNNSSIIKTVDSYFVMIVAALDASHNDGCWKVRYHQARNWKVQDDKHLIIWQKHFCLSAF